MHYFKAIIILIIVVNIASTQDNYHITTEQEIVDTYGLQNGEWVLFDTELQNLDIDYNYGPTDIIPLTSATENFEQIINILNEVEGDYFYDSGWGIPNQVSIQEGDVCLAIINMRKTNNVNDLGKVTLSVQADNSATIEESVTIQLEEQWNQYLVPFQASTNYMPDELVVALGLAWEVQEIELAGVNILNFRNNYSLDALPYIVHNDRYPGYETNAPWRTEANNRIEANRKADLDINVMNNSISIEGANVNIKMLEHEFKWGTEIEISRFADNILHDPVYESKLLDLDGEGHSFTWVAPGDAFKWPGIEENWIAPFSEKVNAVNWLKENDKKIRFHTLVWPGWINTPLDIEANANDPQYIIDRTNEWIEFILTHPDLANAFDEYDVLNETTTNRDYELTFSGFGPYESGREYYIEVMDQFEALQPEKPSVIVDYITISSQQSKGTEYEFLQNTIQELIDAGTDLNGIGFQSHMGHFPTSIYEVEEILTDFASRYDVPLKITEYDFLDPRIDPDVAANYLSDFLTMTFSIPEVDMFIFWGIWDGAHWTRSGNFFYEDWSPKPAAEAAFAKIFNEWWTEEDGQTNEDGLASFRGFKGEYEVSIDYEGTTWVDTVSLSEDLVLDVNLGQTSSTNDNSAYVDLEVFPNPASNSIQIESPDQILSIVIYDLSGKQILSKENLNSNSVEMDVTNIPEGQYFLDVHIKNDVHKKMIHVID